MRKIIATLVIAVAAIGALRAEPYPIGGSTPDRRPAGAPRITEFQRGPTWLRDYDHGIDAPVPGHLGTADQGAWYTPFNRAGMTSPYDIRGWHRPQAETR